MLLRTVNSYNRCLMAKDINNESHHMGVKFSSPFNQLHYYHVCNPGLPPCIGHDLFEGIVAFDMVLFVKYLISQNWFTVSYLNSAINQFKFDPLSSHSKCVPFKMSSSKLSGNASQVWCFLRFFPLLVHAKVKNHKNPVR